MQVACLERSSVGVRELRDHPGQGPSRDLNHGPYFDTQATLPTTGPHRPWQTPHAPSPPSCRSPRARTTARALHSVIHRASVCFHARASIPITFVSLFVVSLYLCIVVSLYLVALLYRCFVASHRLVVSLCRCITSDRHDCGLPRDLRRASGAGRLLCCRLGGIFGLGYGIRVRVHVKLILRRATRHLVALVWVAHLETLV